MIRIKQAAVLLAACLMTASFDALAELTVQVTLGVEGGIPIAVAPFGGPLRGENIGSIVASDLARSGRFKVLPQSQMPERPTAPEQIQFANWTALGMDDLAIGQVEQPNPDRYSARFYLFDTVHGTQLAGDNLPFAAQESRRIAHRIADIIYRQLTGENGAFATRIAYVEVYRGRGPADRNYRLQVADADGFNPQDIIKSNEPIMSPAWSPDGRQIAYVSFENRRPAIYVQTLSSGSREKVSDWPGINGAPAWSPDGSQLAMTLSRDGNPDIYVMNLASRSLRRITDHFAVDTEPSWSPDGSRIVFTSDRGGRPQLYLVSSGGGEPERITFDGDYNAHGVFSPDGKSLAMVHGAGRSYSIALMDLAGRQMRVLTPGPLDESPSFSPNGAMILYASSGDGKDRLFTVSVKGKEREMLRAEGGEARAPAWSPN